MKFIFKFVFITIGALVLIYLGYYVLLGISIKKASDKASEWKREDLFQRSFSGRINLNNLQNLDCQLFLEIISFKQKQPESISICPCKNAEFNRFVSIGDSINKKENTYKATFIKSDGTKKQFDLPLCK
jgi:hypothetical protein